MEIPDMSLARHILIDYYLCDNTAILDKDTLESILNEAAKISGATIVSSHFHNFEPIGVSGVIVLAESHFTVHSWPEHDYAAIDMFAC